MPGLDALLPALLVAQLLLIAVRVLWRRPQRGVLLLAALAPLNGLLLLVPDSSRLELWQEALVLTTLACAVLNPDPAREAGRPWPPWAPAFLGLVLVAAASAVVVGGTQAVVGMKINFFYALLVPVLWRCPFSARERDRLVTILMVTAVVAALVGIVQQVLGGAALNRLGYEYNSTIRTTGDLLRSFGTFNQPFPFGLYEMVVLLVGVPVALAEPRRWRNALFLMATPVMVIGMLSSVVRAAVLGLVVGGLFLWRQGHRGLGRVVPLVLVAALLAPPAVYGPLLSSSSLGQRSAGWSATLDRVLAAPFGNGIGASGSAAEKAAVVEGSPEEQTYQPDNYYYKMVFELGPLGLWMVVLLLVGACTSAAALARRLGASAAENGLTGLQASRDAALAQGTAASVLAAAAASLVATYFEIFPLDVVFWLLLGVLTSVPSRPALASPRPAENAAQPPAVPLA